MFMEARTLAVAPAAIETRTAADAKFGLPREMAMRELGIDVDLRPLATAEAREWIRQDMLGAEDALAFCRGIRQ